MKLYPSPSPNYDERQHAIDMLVLHYTGMETGEEALKRLCDLDAKVSAHYLIEEDGRCFHLVDEDMRAWHAGVAHWAGVDDVNSRSIGIELVNPGHEFGYRPFPEAQIESLITLCHQVVARHAIVSGHVVGHSDVAPARKQDPGELFDWAYLADQGIGLWPKGPVGGAYDSEMEFHQALREFGYGGDVEPQLIIEAFQRRFRPHLINGEADDETQGLIRALLQMKHPLRGQS